ncbi:MAG: hypothetical protein VW268_10525 [Rhodospirillaceae bacterium]
MNKNQTPKMKSIDQDMREVESLIANAKRALLGGDALDLSPLGNRISTLCDGVRGVSKTVSDPEALQRRLAVMVRDLNQLEEIIRAGAEQAGLTHPADAPDGKED